jgi:serine/threonine-protein kinase
VTEGSDAPRVAGKYTLGRLLGRGGMGSVYAGEHVVTGRVVAIKRMSRELAAREDARRRFVREAQAVGRLEHPNVVEVLDAGVDDADGVPYVVQSLLRGATLRAYMTRHPQPGSVVAIGLVLPILRALAAAHDAGVVHRDVKPSNVFLAQVADLGGDRVIPKLLDFGISKFTDARPEEATQLTDTGAAVGTASYMSPEQASAERDVDGRADVWAVGVMLYELLAGERPFEAPSQALVLLKVISQDPPRLETRAVALRTDLADIVHRALARDRDARWPSARAFHDALAEAIGASTREPWTVAPGIESVTAAVEAEVDAGIFSVPGAPSPPLASTVGERPSSRGSVGRAANSHDRGGARRRVRIAVSVGLVALALGFVGTWLATRGPRPEAALYARPEPSPTRPSAAAPIAPTRTTPAAPGLPATEPGSEPLAPTAAPTPRLATPTSPPETPVPGPQAAPRPPGTPRHTVRRPVRPPATVGETPRVGTLGAPILSPD